MSKNPTIQLDITPDTNGFDPANARQKTSKGFMRRAFSQGWGRYRGSRWRACIEISTGSLLTTDHQTGHSAIDRQADIDPGLPVSRNNAYAPAPGQFIAAGQHVAGFEQADAIADEQAR